VPVDEWNARAFLAGVVTRLAANADNAGRHLAGQAASRAPRAPGEGHAGGGKHAADTVTYKVRATPRGIELRVGATHDGWYLALKEVGTSQMAAEPWLRPVIFGQRAEVVRLIIRGA
jgi:HK97 gp10 family phage protein